MKFVLKKTKTNVMTEKKEENGLWEEWDGEYIGNIWGWKFSFISLGIILFAVALMAYRHWTIDPQIQQSPRVESISSDTIGTEIE